jgi:hypothetical protein
MRTFILGCFLLPLILWGQSDVNPIVAKFNKFHLSFSHEKIYLHHDQDAYLLGKKLWFSVYLVNAIDHLPNTLSSVVYVELIGPDDRIMASRNIKIIDGKGEGDFDILQEWRPGNYILRAYTQYMRNYDEDFFFQKTIPVWDAFRFVEKDSTGEQKSTLPASDSLPADFSVQFMPEGGDLVAGIPTVVAFKAVDKDGVGIDVTGRIVDQDGVPIVPLKTLKFGLGSVKLQAQRGKSYQAEITYQGKTRTFDLPQVVSSGYVIQANTANKDEIVMSIQTNIPNGLNDAVLFCHLRGQVFGLIEGMTGQMSRFRLPIEDIPHGVAHFTLFNAVGTPVAERLSFINHPENYPALDIKTNFPGYKKREKVKLTFELQDSIRPAKLSVRVREQLQDLGQVEEINIRNYLLLTSDLKGRIEHPDYYFTDDSPGKRALVDLLMLTQGWRRFKWRDILEVGNPELRYPNEKGFGFEGKITRLNNPDKPAMADVSLTVFNESMQMNQLTTNETGDFYFTGYQFEDTTDVVIQAALHKNKKKKSKPNNTDELGPGGNRNVDIQITRYGRPPVKRELSGNLPNEQKNPYEALRNDQVWSKILEVEYEKYQEFSLKEVVIKGSKTGPVIDRFDRPDVLYKRPDNRVIMDSIAGNTLVRSVFEMIRGRVPGIELVGTPGIDQTVRIRGINSIQGNTTALILLDGVPVDPIAANTINPQRVDFIDVVRGLSATAIYGEQGGNGIVAIYTRTQGMDPKYIKKNGILTITHPGYYQAREFYMPTYDSLKAEDSNPDYRMTLYWNPALEIGDDGKAEVEFFTADRATIYEVEVEGITKDGRPIVGKTALTVE